MKSTITTLFISLFAVLLVTSCGSKKETANQENSASEFQMPEPEMERVIIDEGFVPPRENGAFNVESMDIVDAKLTLSVSYSGGCEEHEFNLYSPNQYAKSYPPQLSLFLQHIDNGDNCRARIYKDLIFDISGVEYDGTNTLIIKVNNTKETIEYKY